MTGFARAAASDERFAWTWEARSVNGRSLDVRCRIAPGFDQLESPARAAAAKRFNRGNINLSLGIERKAGTARVIVNREVLDQVLALVKDLEGKVNAAPARLDGLLAVRGVVETVEETDQDEEVRTARDAAILKTLDAALSQLQSVREAEGLALAATLSAHIDEIELLIREAAANAAAQPAAMKARLEAQLAELLGAQPPLPPDRLAQEVALLATRGDVREELDRLTAHIAAARTLLTDKGAIGRRLEFLAQEFNREANTLCSKSADVALTQTGLALKAVIDRLREQAANVE
ncbi:MAG TPA: YicC/YloC family endoribonuclease [Alphaproteobacteria bacterium]|nr:YicC/YloC family endoribonuclease [Alphaproteobacteria bacterium]